MRALALFVGAIAAVHAEFNPVQTVMGIPSAVRGGLTRFREGTGDMWTNGKAAGSIRKRIQKGGEPASYPELVLLRKSGEDLGKLVQAGVMCVVAPEYIPFALVFYPNALPSTFERPKGRERRLATLGRLRTKAVLDLVIKLEEQAVKPRQNKKTEQARALSEQASAVLRASGPSAALKTLPAALSPAPPPKKPGKKPPPATLKGVPDPLLKAGCTLIGAGPAPLGFLRRAALQKHLGHLAEEDVALATTDLRELSHSQLVDACYDRAVGRAGDTDAQLRAALSAWLKLVGEHADAEPQQLRLGALAVSAVAGARQAEDWNLPRLVYLGK